MMWSVSFFAIITLVVFNDEFNNKSLLNGRSCVNFLLAGNLYFQTLGVRFSPKESGINQLHSLKTFHLLEAKGEEFW